MLPALSRAIPTLMLGVLGAAGSRSRSVVLSVPVGTARETTTLVPVGSIFVRNAWIAPENVKGPVAGKFGEDVAPVIYALPLSSTAMARPSSLALPPKYVE